MAPAGAYNRYLMNYFNFALGLMSDVLLELALTVNLKYSHGKNSHGKMASALDCETKFSLKSPVQYKTLAHDTPFTFIAVREIWIQLTTDSGFKEKKMQC